MPRTGIKKLQAALRSWEDGLARLGECMVRFQHIEEALSRCISGMIGRDHRVGNILTSELSFRGKVAIYTALFLHRTGLRDLPADVSELIGRLHSAEQRRNTLVHSIWDASVKNPGTIRRLKSACRKKGLIISLEHITPDELDEDAHNFEGIAEDVFYHTLKHIPKIERRIRRGH